VSAVVNLTGLIEDGSSRAPEMPRESATTFHLTAGQTSEVLLRLFYPSAVPVPVASWEAGSWSARLAIACSVEACALRPDWSIAGALEAAPGAGNTVRFPVPAGTFRGAQPGRYYADAWLIRGAERWQVLQLSGLILHAGLVRP
jgi:hypothetical protein